MAAKRTTGRGIVQVDFDAAFFRRQVNGFRKRQIPFAMAQALNWTIEEAREELQGDLSMTFTIRNKRTEQGIRTARATKKKLGAVVGSLDDYMRRQAVGDEKRAQKGKQGVPVQARKNPKTRLTPGKWPGAVLGKRKGAFVREGSGGVDLIMVPLRPRRRKAGKSRRRRGRRKRKSRGRLKLMYLMKRTIQVPERWPLEETLDKVARKRWVPNMAKSWKRALATARRK